MGADQRRNDRARPAEKDLSGLAAAPVTLFSASQAPWVRATSYVGRFDGYITDGPFSIA